MRLQKHILLPVKMLETTFLSYNVDLIYQINFRIKYYYYFKKI